MRRFIPWLIIFLVSIPVILPLTKSGFFPTHDGEWAVVRLAEMHRELKDMQIPPRWADFLNHGYGYPLFMYTYPAPFYLGEVFHIAGIGLVDSVKIVFILSVILSAVFMYLLARELTGPTAGIIASSLYIIAPFRLVDIYVRGSIGESLAFAVFPLLFWSTLKLILDPNLGRISLTAASLAFLILTHNISALLFLPFWFIFLFVEVKYYYEDFSKYFLHYFAPAIILGFALSAFFWAPAIMEKKYILLSLIPLADKMEHFIRPLEFWNSPWNYGLRPSFQLGWLHILSFILGVIILLTERGVDRKKNFLLGSYLLISILSLLFLTQSISLPVWQFPLLREIDFPWRILGVLSFFLSLGAMYVSQVPLLKKAILFLLFLSLLLVPRFAKPESFFTKDNSYYETNDATTTSMDELTPVWVSEKPRDRPASKVDIIRGSSKIEGLFYNSHNIDFNLNSSSESIVSINTIYFPGWSFTLDGKPVLIDYNNPTGLMTLEVPQGRHMVVGKFERTPIRLLADIISLIAFLIITSLILKDTISALRRKFLK